MIMPCDYSKYPPNWPEISLRIRERSGGQCECDGRCGHPHGGRCDARHGSPHPVTGSRVVLTVAHLDHNPDNCADSNLAAYCQRCHLAYDLEEHRRRAAETRRRKREQAGQMRLGGVE